MADNKFTAFARIPTRPLSMDNKDLAEPKELLADYVNHELYICDVDGSIVNVTASVTTVVNEVMKNINSNPTIVTDAEIELPSGEKVTIESGLIDAITKIEELQDSLGLIKDELGNIVLKIDPDDIVESNEKQFVSSNEKTSWDNKAEIIQMNATILSGSSNWTATDSSAPYTQTVNIADMKASYYPIVDIVLSDDYDTAMRQLTSYSYIYKIITYDGSIKVFASSPIDEEITIVMKIDK